MLTLSASWAALTLAAILIHLVADWFFQNDWMAKNKAKRMCDAGLPVGKYTMASELWLRRQWFMRHPAAYVHAGIHGLCLLLVFPWWAALIVAVLHLIIDCRSPLEYWGKFTRQTRPRQYDLEVWKKLSMADPEFAGMTKLPPTVMDIGMEVAFWRDQVAHFVIIAVVALFV